MCNPTPYIRWAIQSSVSVVDWMVRMLQATIRLGLIDAQQPVQIPSRYGAMELPLTLIRDRNRNRGVI